MTKRHAFLTFLAVGSSGCVAALFGTHQDITFESKVPGVSVTLDGKSAGHTSLLARSTYGLMIA